jgi:hypothetical protein
MLENLLISGFGPSRSSPSTRTPSTHKSSDEEIKKEEDVNTEKKPHLFVMTKISISPKNHFKKMSANAHNKFIDVNNSSFMHTFH